MPTAPTTTRAGRLGKVDVALHVLRAGWVNGRGLLDGVRASAQDILGEPAAYDNANAAARNARWAALAKGKCWQLMSVNYREDDGGADHRLWTITDEMVARPHPAWQRGEASVVMQKMDGEGQVTERIFYRQQVDNVGDGRVASREVLALQSAGSNPAPPARHRPRRPCLSGGALAGRREEQGRLL